MNMHISLDKAQISKSLSYCLFETKNQITRLSQAFDKLIIFCLPHILTLNKTHLSIYPSLVSPATTLGLPLDTDL